VKKVNFRKWTLLWAEQRRWAAASLYTIRINFDVNIERAACDTSSEMWHLSTNSAFEPGLKKNHRIH
jgi:hypothetical protein